MPKPGVKPGMHKNMLTAICEVGEKSKNKMWLFRCDCGNKKIIRASSFLTGRTKSCGCLTNQSNSVRMRKHGLSRTRLYINWRSMLNRCFNPKASGYSTHGGRGITICNEWMNVKNFYDWSLKNGFHDGMQLDRIDNDGNYCPANCQWLSRSDHCSKTHRDLGSKMWKGVRNN